MVTFRKRKLTYAEAVLCAFHIPIHLSLIITLQNIYYYALYE